MIAEFNQWGIQFKYPENWAVDSDGQRGGLRSVSVHSPGGAFWSVTTDGPEDRSLAQRVAEALCEEYDSCEMEAMARQIAGHRVEGFELNFYCLDFLITAHVLSLRVPSGYLAVLYQAESRDFEQLQPVFDAISSSLVQHQTLME